ncbi:MAG: sugar ABC transporter permease [Bifidobacteriaceae bacterium]|jgi:putative multiple sugar transport system permease protein|nr:sugar ABC transporter permease [Bifidobacteriaceae bacterium]
MTALKEFFSRNLRSSGTLIALLIVVIFFEIATKGRLLMPDNISSLIQQNAYVLLLAVGMCMIIVALHIDLSAGSVVAFLGGCLGWFMYHHVCSWPLACLITIVLGLLVGVWQGFWIAFVGIPAFVVTLAGQLIFRGLAIVIAGVTMSGFSNGFNDIANSGIPAWLDHIHLGAQGVSVNSGGPYWSGDYDLFTLLLTVICIVAYVYFWWRGRHAQIKHGLVPEGLGAAIIKVVCVCFGILAVGVLLAKGTERTPIVLIICGVVIFVYSFIFRRTVYGRDIYAIGGNRNAAMMSGIKTRRIDFALFVNMGFLASIAAIVVTSRAGAATSLVGQNYELDAISACFIGGAAVTGGVGRISGAMIGAILVGSLNMGMSILNVDSAWQQVVKGLVLLIAVVLDVSQRVVRK